MSFPSHRLKLWLAVALAVPVVGCGGSNALDSADAGRTFSYAPGTPNFDLEAISTWQNEKAGIDVYMSIPYRSLAYVNRGDQFNARFEIILQVLDEEGEMVIAEDMNTVELEVATYDSTQSWTPFVIEERMEAATGTYIIQVVLEDRLGEKRAVRAQRVDVVAWTEETPSLSRIRLEAKDEMQPFKPLLAPHISNELDSLRAVIELYNAADPSDLSMVLLQPETNTDPAEPPYWFQLRNQRYTYEGLNYRRADTIQVTRRTLRNPARELTVEFTLPELEEGVYRLEINADFGDEAAQTVTLQRRDFTVKGSGFPQITSMDEMIDALIYIARDREMDRILEAETIDERRKEFEKFWLERTGNPRGAADLIKRYYSRVEEANLLFSSHKRGWKTDRGMVYIVMGPPNYVDRRYGDGRRLFVWRYPPPKQSSAPMGYYPVDPNRSPVSQMETRFIFEEVRKLDRDIPYPQYILRRDRIYQRVWEDAVLLWRSGRML